MSLALSIQFLTGRYHATPWDHQVNEGVVEYPPSPWRILRALVSAYYRLPDPPERALCCQVLTKLAHQPPSYALPAYTAAHTRHYMPIWKEGKATTTKVFDTFFALPGGAFSLEATVQVVWSEVQLSQPEQQLLAQLCHQISYLGRAESWVEITLSTGGVTCNAIPMEPSTMARGRPVKVLAPLTVAGLEGFQTAIAALPSPKKGKVRWKAPADILEALELDIGRLHRQGWHGIPGARWLTYDLEAPTDIPSVALPTKSVESPTFARFALASKVLPKLTQAVSVGERFHQALIAWSKDSEGQGDPIFVGRTFPAVEGQEQAAPAAGQQHAWYLPEANAVGEIDHVVVYAAGGFGARAVSALCRLPKVWGTEGFDLQTVLIALGQVETYGSEQGYQPGRSPLVSKSRSWRSLTPMVLPRHPKQDRRYQPKLISGTGFQVDGPEHQALRLLGQIKPAFDLKGVVLQCLEEADRRWLGWLNAEGQFVARVRCLDMGASHYDWQAFQRRRYHGQGKKQSDRGYWLELEFQEAQQGPLALGYGAHFGLGVFVPVP